MIKKIIKICFSGDELSFTVKNDGSVEFMRNNSIPSVFMHVDITQPLWAFWDIYGNTSRIRILGSCQQSLLRTSASVLPRQQSNQQLVQVESTTKNGMFPHFMSFEKKM